MKKTAFLGIKATILGLSLAVLPLTAAAATMPSDEEKSSPAGEQSESAGFHDVATETFNRGGDVNAALAEIGYTEVTAPTASPRSTGADVNMGAVQVFTSGGPIGSYGILATYSWNDTNAKFFDGTSTDVMGISLSDPRNVQSSSASFCNTANDCTGITNPETLNQNGVAYANSGAGSDNVRATVGLTIDRAGPCDFQAFSTYSHGWDETVLTGVGIGRGSVSVSWNTSGQNFAIAGGPGNCA